MVFLAPFALTLATPILEPKVEAASLFKNGYAVVMRSATLSGSGEYMIDSIPTAVLGILWVTADAGVKFSELIATHREEKTEKAVGNLMELLRANVGRTLNFEFRDAKEGASKAYKIEHVMSDSVLLSDGNETTTVMLNNLQRVAGPSNQVIWKLPQMSRVNCYRFKASAPANAKIYIFSLEHGLTWAPAYAADITDPKILRLTMRCTILNDLAALNNIELRLITGFPNVPYIGWIDPFSMRQSVADFTASLMNLGVADAQRGPGMMMQNQAGRVSESFSAAFNPSDLPGLASEDLFFYRQPGVSLKPGDRGYFVLLEFESPYQHIYEWDIPDDVVNDAYNTRSNPEQSTVWHSLKFTNASKQPLTTAAAITVKDGQLLGQDLLNYTSSGAEVRLRITKALDVQAEAAEQEIDRKPMVEEGTGYRYDLVTLKGTLLVRNRKSEDVDLRITKLISGTLLSSKGSPKSISLGRGLRALNPRVSLSWEAKVKAGESVDFAYTYQVKLR